MGSDRIRHPLSGNPPGCGMDRRPRPRGARCEAGRYEHPRTLEPSAAPQIGKEPSPSDQATTRSPPPEVPEGAVEVQVVKHTDGDTLHVVPLVAGGSLIAGADTTVRLLEVDAPESVDPASPVQCFARQASAALRDMLPVGNRAWATEDVEPLDRYGRTLLYLWSDDGTFVNLELVRAGMARAVLYEPNDAYIFKMRKAERRARAAGLGQWRRCQRNGPHHLRRPARTPRSVQRVRSDPRFDYCYQANSAGFGNYERGVSKEYTWYDDVDHDGIVCEF